MSMGMFQVPLCAWFSPACLPRLPCLLGHGLPRCNKTDKAYMGMACQSVGLPKRGLPKRGLPTVSAYKMIQIFKYQSPERASLDVDTADLDFLPIDDFNFSLQAFLFDCRLFRSIF